MKKSLMMLFGALFLTITFSYAQSPSGSKCDSDASRHVVILSMDGFRWDYTLDAHTPTLDSLRRVGSSAQILPVFPANTFPNHYSMATGLHPDHHGVTNNGFYDETLGRHMSVFKAEDCLTEGFWGGEPIWNTVELQGGISHIYMWPGSEYPINGRQATIWSPYDHTMDYYVRADNVVKSMSLPADQAPNLVMWYMPDPDEVGHHYGPNSPECIARVEYIDQVLSYFFEKMRSTPYFDNTDFIVTADHGMTQMAPERYMNMYGAVDDEKINYYVAATPFGFDVEEEYIDEAVEALNALGNLTAYRSDAMPEEFHYGTHPTRVPNIIVLPNIGWKLDYTTKEPRLPKGGSHGFSHFESDMQMVFFAAGPSFKSGFAQPSFQNQNIYMLICELLGITPAENDGERSAYGSMLK